MVLCCGSPLFPPTLEQGAAVNPGHGSLAQYRSVQSLPEKPLNIKNTSPRRFSSPKPLNDIASGALSADSMAVVERGGPLQTDLFSARCGFAQVLRVGSSSGVSYSVTAPSANLFMNKECQPLSSQSVGPPSWGCRYEPPLRQRVVALRI